MAKAALEMVVLHAELRTVGIPLSGYLGSTHTTVPSGVSVGIHPSISALLETVGGYLDDRCVRIKLKINPGWDLEPVCAVRERFGFGDIPLQVDAKHRVPAGRCPPSGAAARVRAAADRAAVGGRRSDPACRWPGGSRRDLPDESITSAKVAADAIRLNACSGVNTNSGRVGGNLEARRVHDVCAASGVPVWCGEMLETGLGRADMALPAFTLPGDTSASDRFHRRDIITEPFRIWDGHIAVPVGPRLGVDVDPDALAAVTVSQEWLPLDT